MKDGTGASINTDTYEIMDSQSSNGRFDWATPQISTGSNLKLGILSKFHAHLIYIHSDFGILIEFYDTLNRRLLKCQDD